MSSFIAFLKRWYPSIILGVTALWGVFGTGIQHAISANPKLYLALTTALGILMHLLPSPLPPTAAVRAQVRKMAQAGILDGAKITWPDGVARIEPERCKAEAK